MKNRKWVSSSVVLGVFGLLLANACAAKTPVDLTLDFLMGPKLGGQRFFTCREAVDGKVTDEHEVYHFGPGWEYSRLNSYVDHRTRYAKPMNIKGEFDVKIEDNMLKIVFKDKWVEWAGAQLANPKPYSAILIGTADNKVMALAMDRPVPESNGLVDHIRLACTGGEPMGGGPQRSY